MPVDLLSTLVEHGGLLVVALWILRQNISVTIHFEPSKPGDSDTDSQ